MAYQEIGNIESIAGAGGLFVDTAYLPLSGGTMDRGAVLSFAPGGNLTPIAPPTIDGPGAATTDRNYLRLGYPGNGAEIALYADDDNSDRAGQLALRSDLVSVRGSMSFGTTNDDPSQYANPAIAIRPNTPGSDEAGVFIESPTGGHTWLSYSDTGSHYLTFDSGGRVRVRRFTGTGYNTVLDASEGGVSVFSPNGGTIGGTNLDNGWLRVGSGGSMLSMDPNELMFANTAYLGSLGEMNYRGTNHYFQGGVFLEGISSSSTTSTNNKYQFLFVDTGADNKIYRQTSKASFRTMMGVAAASHSHSGYASSTHSHSGYASSGHTHSIYSQNGHTHDYFPTYWDNPDGSGSLNVAWYTHWVKYRFGGSSTPNGVLITNYDNNGLLLYRHGYIVAYSGYQHASTPTHNNSNGSMRWMGTWKNMGQAHTSSSLATKKNVKPIRTRGPGRKQKDGSFSKTGSVFDRLEPIHFEYADDHPFRDRWKGKRLKPDKQALVDAGKVTPPSGWHDDPDWAEEEDHFVYELGHGIGRMGFAYEQVKEVAPHFTYVVDGMEAVGYEGMLPDFMAWSVATIRDLRERLDAAGL